MVLQRLGAITETSETIVVESVDQFLDSNGSILIGDEVVYYESTTSSPNIALSLAFRMSK